MYAILASNGPYEATLIQKGVTGDDTVPPGVQNDAQNHQSTRTSDSQIILDDFAS
jgi:hypothetical protein